MKTLIATEVNRTEDVAMPITILSSTGRRVPLPDQDLFIGSVQGTDELRNHLVLCEIYVSNFALVIEGVRYRLPAAKQLYNYIGQGLSKITPLVRLPLMATLDRLQLKWQQYQQICEAEAKKNNGYDLALECQMLIQAELAEQFQADLQELHNAMEE